MEYSFDFVSDDKKWDMAIYPNRIIAYGYNNGGNMINITKEGYPNAKYIIFTYHSKYAIIILSNNIVLVYDQDLNEIAEHHLDQNYEHYITYPGHENKILIGGERNIDILYVTTGKIEPMHNPGNEYGMWNSYYCLLMVEQSNKKLKS